VDPIIEQRRKDARWLYTLTAWFILVTILALSSALVGIGQSATGEIEGPLASIGLALFLFAWAPFAAVLGYGRHVAARRHAEPADAAA
jgi:hypothetical protein